MAKQVIKRPSGKRAAKKKTTVAKSHLTPSKLKVFDIPITQLLESPDNPQEMDDAMFDELVDGIRTEGMDEPIHVIRMYDPETGEWTGQYMITSGHHRTKAAKIVGMTAIPAIIKQDMDDAARKIALVRRNQLHGTMNSKKFSALFREVVPVLGAETAKRLMGFTKEAVFKKMYDEVARSLPSGARKKMEDAKETVRSVDDLSSILNGIFREEGSKVRQGYAVFSYGGKKHHYFQIGAGVSKILEKIGAHLESANITADAFFGSVLKDHAEVKVERSKVKRKPRRA